MIIGKGFKLESAYKFWSWNFLKETNNWSNIWIKGLTLVNLRYVGVEFYEMIWNKTCSVNEISNWVN